jgi:DNA-binding winged helix-turn-helix (wHTH) protein/predicted ATPase
MHEETQLLFGVFRLDLANEWLRRGEQALALTPKAFAVLRYLAEHSGRLVTKEELFQAVWPETVVSDAALTVCIRVLRQVLSDDAKTPQFIETVHRRGYRFIAPVTTTPQRVSSSKFQVSSSHSAFRTPHSAIRLVGREAELTRLHSLLEKALNGERQIVFVTGEPGIGKTALVEAFLDGVAVEGGPWIGQGQCIEHFGAGEPYLPVLAALGQLGQEPGGERLIALLGQRAPTWLVQMPMLLSAIDMEALQRRTLGATRERMLREMAEAVEALTTQRPAVLWLEDLHWCDCSTLELLSLLARGQQPARLLVLGTYRPVEVIVREHPLRVVEQELHLHGRCEELALGFLTEGDVAMYLAARFAVGAQHAGLLRELARTTHQRTDGNPLFMVNVVNDMIARGVVRQIDGQWEFQAAPAAVKVGVPESIHQMIEQQIERLHAEDQRVLEVASVAGAEFSAAAVAAALGDEVGAVEARCAGLVRREQFLRATGTSEWPDGTVAASFGFLHALYREVLYERVTAGRRIQLHQRIGEREEQAYGERASELAAELAVHFERGRDYRRAVQYLGQAAARASQRLAYVEAIGLLTKGLELLKTLPDTPERARQELTLQIALGAPLQLTRGYASPEVEATYARARELCRQVGETPQLFPVLLGLGRLYLARGQLQRARELREQLLALAPHLQDPGLLVRAYTMLAQTSYQFGDFVLARDYAEQGIALYDPQQHRSHVFLYGNDARVASLSFACGALWYLGYPDQALQRSREALAWAQELSHPVSVTGALIVAAILHQRRREGQVVQERAEAAMTLSTEQGFSAYLAVATILRGWALAEQGPAEEGIAQMRQGLSAHRATGAEQWQRYFLALLAEAYAKIGQPEQGMIMLAEALAAVNKTGQHDYEAELYRLKGELTLAQSSDQGLASSVQANHKAKRQGQKAKISSLQLATPTAQAEAEAEACFHNAIEIAQRQSAKSLELRAATSLTRLWQRQGKKKQARRVLAEIYGWFTEGFDTADLKEAKALLDDLKWNSNRGKEERT